MSAPEPIPTAEEWAAAVATLPAPVAAALRAAQRDQVRSVVLRDTLAAARGGGTLDARLQVFVDGMRALGVPTVAIVLLSASGVPEFVVAARGVATDVDRMLSSAAATTWEHPLAEGLGAVSIPVATEPGGAAIRVLLVPPDAPVDAGLLAALRLLADEAARTVQEVAHAESVARRIARLKYLQTVGGQLSRTLDPDEVCRELVRQVEQVIPCRGIVIAHPDLEQETLRIGLHVDGGVERVRESSPLGAGIIATVARSGDAVHIPVVGSEPGHAVALSDLVGGDVDGVGSALAVPLRSGGRLLGVLGVYARARQAFDADDVLVLATIADHAAIALINAESYTTSQQERRQTEALSEVARAVTASLKLRDVLRLIQRHLLALLGAEGAAVMLRKGEHLHVVSASGAGEPLAGMFLPLHASMSGRVVRSGRYLIANDVAADPDSYVPMRELAGVRRTVIAPLLTADHTSGAIAIFNREMPFTDADARVLQRLSDHVAVAVVNARLFEESLAASRELSLLFDTIAAGLVVVDHYGCIVRANVRATELLGAAASADLLLGRSFQDALLGESASTLRPLDRTLLDRQAHRATVVHPDAGLVYDLVVSPHPEGGAVVFFDDVTSFHALADRYRDVLDRASDAVYTLDRDALITSVNAAGAALFGVDREAAVGTPIAHWWLASESAVTSTAVSETLRGESVRFECHTAPVEGVSRWLSVSHTPLRHGGVVTGILGIARDVTQERVLMTELVRQERLAALGQLVGGVAHELNNPLTGISTHAQLLGEPSTTERERREYGRVIAAESARAVRIVRKLLAFVRQGDADRIPVDVNQLVRDTVELRAHFLRKQQIVLELQLAPEAVFVLGDPASLQQVLVNLLTNAEHAVVHGERPRCIVISTTVDAHRVRCAVTDSGVGIPPDQLERIFNPFHTTKPRGLGTGLGLPISDGIVREHGGTLTVRSTVADGSTFVIDLPVRRDPSA